MAEPQFQRRLVGRFTPTSTNDGFEERLLELAKEGNYFVISNDIQLTILNHNTIEITLWKENPKKKKESKTK